MPPDAYLILDKPKIKKGKRRKAQTLIEYGLEHSVLVALAGAAYSSKIDYDPEKLKAIYKPEDPDE